MRRFAEQRRTPIAVLMAVLLCVLWAGSTAAQDGSSWTPRSAASSGSKASDKSAKSSWRPKGLATVDSSGPVDETSAWSRQSFTPKPKAVKPRKVARTGAPPPALAAAEGTGAPAYDPAAPYDPATYPKMPVQQSSQSPGGQIQAVVGLPPTGNAYSSRTNSYPTFPGQAPTTSSQLPARAPGTTALAGIPTQNPAGGNSSQQSALEARAAQQAQQARNRCSADYTRCTDMCAINNDMTEDVVGSVVTMGLQLFGGYDSGVNSQAMDYSQNLQRTTEQRMRCEQTCDVTNDHCLAVIP